jgi:RHS repeat-associated protein
VWSLNNPLHEWTVPNMADTDKPDRRSLITWIFEPGRWAPLAKLDGQECFSVLTDFRGVPLAAANTRGHIVWSGDTDLYGRLEIFTGEKSLIPFRLAGQYEDTETGLYYNRFRYYDPWTGVFLSRDPTRLKYGIRRYAFVNDPILMADPLGLHEVYAWIRDEAGQTTPVPGPTRNGTWRSTRRGPHSEEHLINHLETHPDVPGNTVVIQSIGQPRMDDARNLSTLPPCGPEARNCDQALEDFAHRRGCNVEYHWVDREGVPQVQHYPRPCA